MQEVVPFAGPQRIDPDSVTVGGKAKPVLFLRSQVVIDGVVGMRRWHVSFGRRSCYAAVARVVWTA